LERYQRLGSISNGGKGRVTTPVPTKVGDALILLTRGPATNFAEGVVTRKGQVKFNLWDHVAHSITVVLAIEAAKALLRPRGRIYLVDIDSDDWSELPG
jgi:hypothetical protein